MSSPIAPERPGANDSCSWRYEIVIHYGRSFLHSAVQRLPYGYIRQPLACAAFLLCCQISSMAQLPRINTGADSGFSEIDLAQIYLDTQNRDVKKSERQQAENKKLVD